MTARSRRASHRLRCLVSGRIARFPEQGGATWAVLQYVLGLRRLGHDVTFAEALPPSAVRPAGAHIAQSHNAARVAAVMSEFALDGKWALLVEGTAQSAGLAYTDLTSRTFDVHVNLSGCFRDLAVTDAIPVRVYVDLDPAFTQVWHAVDGLDVGLAGHTHFVTVGAGVGTAQCPVPTCGVSWFRSLPPVVLPYWSVGAPIRRDAMTTVANWRSYGSTVLDGTPYGQRAHSFRAFFGLPRAAKVPLQPALSIDPAEVDDLAALDASGWTIIDPDAVARTPDQYRDFVRSSRGEIAIAKQGYVVSRSGWFSDRSACYLAAGRPVVAQDTGFAHRLPVGEGLLSFSSPAEAVDALDRVAAEPHRHAAAARRIATAELDADVVLGDLLRYAGVGA